MSRKISRTLRDGRRLVFDFDDLRMSKKFMGVYYQTVFVRERYLGEEDSVSREFKIGQSEKGYCGHYEAYIYIPSHWKFSTLSREEMAIALDIYGGEITWKNIYGPDGTAIQKLNCIGWSYSAGLEGEEHIGREDVSKDISYAIEDILRWQWENDGEVMRNTLRANLEKAYNQLKYGRMCLNDAGVFNGEVIDSIDSMIDLISDNDKSLGWD